MIHYENISSSAQGSNKYLLTAVCCNNSTISFSIHVSFFFQDFLKASKKQITISEI